MPNRRLADLALILALSAAVTFSLWTWKAKQAAEQYSEHLAAELRQCETVDNTKDAKTK